MQSGCCLFEGFLNEVNLFILVGEVTFLRVEAAVVLGKEVPPKHKVIDKVFNDAAVHPHESPIDAEAYVDDAKRVYLAAINADGPSFEGLNLIFEQVGVAL